MVPQSSSQVLVSVVTKRVAAAAAAIVGVVILPGSGRPPVQELSCVVERVIDGDTLLCDGGERVRLLLIDSPEMRHRDLGPAARAALENLSPPGTRLRVELDVAARDRYRRLLAYLYLPNGTMVNEEMARLGYATPMVEPPNVRHVERIRAAAADARRRNRGLWRTGLEAYTTPGDDCSPAYPDTCIPAPPPDLDCRDVPYRNFRVLSPDPHRFDGDGDGVGCETEGVG